MIIVIYKEHLITKIISVRTEQELIDGNILQKNEEYKTFSSTKAYKGLDIRALNDDGGLLPISEQLELGIISLADDEILENEIIRKLSEDELKEKFPDRYPEEETDPITLELANIETEIKAIEDEALKSIIQDRINGSI